MSVTFGKPEIVVNGEVLLNKKKSKSQVARERLLEKEDAKQKKA